MKHCLQIKLPPAFLEKILKTLAEQVHNHYMVHFAVFCFFVTHEVQEGDKCLASELVNQLALPKQHDVTLHLNCFFLEQSKTSSKNKARR